MQPFIYDQPASRIIFGSGTSKRLYEELKRLSVNRPFFIATPGRRHDAEQAVRALSEITAAIYSDAVPALIVGLMKRGLKPRDYILTEGSVLSQVRFN